MNSHVLTAVAWPYANGPRHIGHVSGFGVPSDVFSRYLRMSGHDVLMVSGTDEHGTPILVQAEREGLSPREIADKYNRVIVEDLQGLGLSYDLFTRTTTRNHYRVAQELFVGLYRNGYVVPRTAMGAVSPSSGRTLPDRYIEGTCPICGYPSARGDQCDNCGNQLDPVDLINPRLPDQRRDAGVRGDRALLPRPAGAVRLAGEVARRPDRLAAQRVEVQPEPAGGPAAPGDHPGSRLGRSGAVGRLARSADEAAVRVVRCGDRLPVGLGGVGRPDRRPGGLAAVVEDPEALGHYFMGKDNIVFHTVIWPGMLLGHNGAG